MNVQPLERLAAEWREQAAILRRRGAEGNAEALESCAADLEVRLRAWQLEALTLEQAVHESGLSYSALQKQLARGEVENAGTKGSPRIRRCDLPRKAGRSGINAVSLGGPDLAAEVLASRFTRRLRSS